MKSSASVVNPVSAVVSPDDYFSRPLSYTDAVVPLAVMAVGGVWLNHAMQPFVASAIAQSLPPEAAARFASDSASASVPWIGDAGALLMPVITSGLYALTALIMVGAFSERTVSFVTLHVCAAWCTLVLTGKAVAQYALLSTGARAITGPRDLAPGIGFGFLAPVEPSVLHDVLDLINGFDVGFLVAFAATVRLSTGVSRPLAWAAVAVPWVLLAAVKIGLSAVLYR